MGLTVGSRLFRTKLKNISARRLGQTAALFVVIVIATQAYATTYYVDYSTGNDSNSGTSESAPWKHAPGMKGLTPTGSSTGDGCSATCASYTPQPGDQIILKGGSVWAYTTAPWVFSWSGSGSTSTYGCQGSGCIYIGNAVGAGLPAWNDGTVVSISLKRDIGGWNPSSPPIVSCSGGGGSGAAATTEVVPASESDPLISGFIYFIKLTSQGSGYTSAPTCTLTGGSGTATLAADIDRAIFDLGATQSSPPDWPMGACGSYPNTCVPGLTVSGNYVTVSGIEVRNLLQQNDTGSGTNDELQAVVNLGGTNDTATNLFVHGYNSDCVASNTACAGEWEHWGIGPGNAHDEVSYSNVSNGDFAILGTAAQESAGICEQNELCVFGAFGIGTGTQAGYGPVSIHNNVEYMSSWQIRLAGTDAGGSDPFLVYDNETWLTTYQLDQSAHINRQYSQLQTPAELISYNNVDHNHVAGSGNQQECQPSMTLYFFNNVVWGTGTSTQSYSLTPTSGGCTAYFYNNTMYNPTSPYTCITSGGATTTTTIVLQNNHCITGPSVIDPFYGSASNVAFANQAGSTTTSTVQASNVTQSTATASSQGYTLSNLLSPVSSSNDTVKFSASSNSANLTSLCVGYLTPLCADINGNARPSSGSWQAGAYQYGSGGSSSSSATPPQPPSNLTAAVD